MWPRSRCASPSRCCGASRRGRSCRWFRTRAPRPPPPTRLDQVHERCLRGRMQLHSRMLHPALCAMALPLLATSLLARAAPVRRAGALAASPKPVPPNNSIIPLPLTPIVPSAQRACASKTPSGLGYTMLRPAAGAQTRGERHRVGQLHRLSGHNRSGVRPRDAIAAAGRRGHSGVLARPADDRPDRHHTALHPGGARLWRASVRADPAKLRSRVPGRGAGLQDRG